MKYKVGDKVKLRKGIKEGEFYEGMYYPRGIKEFASGVMTIEKVYASFYKVKENTFSFNDKMVEGFEKEIEEFKKGEFVINPETQEEYNSLMELLEAYGLKWMTDSKPTGLNYFYEYGNKTSIQIHASIHSCRCNFYYDCIENQIKHGNKVITYKQFIEGEFMKQFNKHDLKVGDVITFRNGETGTWTKQGVSLLDGRYIYDVYLSFDLENTGAAGHGYNIVKVERIKGTETLYERKEEVLDKDEKNYLRNLIRPFRDKVQNIIKGSSLLNGEYISIRIKNDTSICLPYFKNDTLYKGMELERYYTLEELGL